MQDRTDSLGINPSYGNSHHSGVWDVWPVDQGPTVQVNLLLSGYVCPYVFMDRCTFFKGDKNKRFLNKHKMEIKAWSWPTKCVP